VTAERTAHHKEDVEKLMASGSGGDLPSFQNPLLAEGMAHSPAKPISGASNDALSGTSEIEHEKLQAADASGSISNASLPGRVNNVLMLWEEAYVKVHQSEPDLIGRYEGLIARYVPTTSQSGSVGRSAAIDSDDEPFSQMKLRMHRTRMNRALDAFLHEHALEDAGRVEHPDFSTIRTLKSYLDIIRPAALSKAQCSVVWTCGILAFKVCLILHIVGAPY
jgi:hypothetical protein